MDALSYLVSCFDAESSVFQTCKLLRLFTMKVRLAKPPTQLDMLPRTLAKCCQPSSALERHSTLFRRAGFGGNYCRNAAVH